MKMTMPLTFARFFRRIAHPIPQSYAPRPTYDCLLERYTYLQAEDRSNHAPLLHLFPVNKHPLPDLIQRLDATLWTAFRRPYSHILYSADNNLQNHQPLPFTLVRQWVYQSHWTRPTITVATFLEPANHPIEGPWLSYWTAINNSPPTPPSHFWKGSPPLMMSQDARGILQFPGPTQGLK